METGKLFVFILLVFCVRQSTSKTKRSKKDEVIHVTRRQSKQGDVIDDVTVYAGLQGTMPDVDVSQVPSRSLTCLPRCISCDTINGCTQCRSRTFLYLKNLGHRQEGVCLHQCPEGYYGLRGTTTNTCRRCEASNCISCFTHNYCTACQEGYLLHEARCLKTCPNDLAPDKKMKKCEPKVDCILSSWSSWSKCARRKPSRSCKYGRKKRTRTAVQEPTENGTQCSKLKETKRCKTPENKCPLINKWLLKQLRKKKVKKTKGQKSSKKNRKRRRKKITTNDSNLTPPRSGKLSIET